MKINKISDTLGEETKQAYLSALKDSDEPLVITREKKNKKGKKKLGKR